MSPSSSMGEIESRGTFESAMEGKRIQMSDSLTNIDPPSNQLLLDLLQRAVQYVIG
jgi:hypothetical protein